MIKNFVVSDVLPKTTRLKIIWNEENPFDFYNAFTDANGMIELNGGNFRSLNFSVELFFQDGITEFTIPLQFISGEAIIEYDENEPNDVKWNENVVNQSYIVFNVENFITFVNDYLDGESLSPLTTEEENELLTIKVVNANASTIGLQYQDLNDLHPIAEKLKQKFTQVDEAIGNIGTALDAIQLIVDDILGEGE